MEQGLIQFAANHLVCYPIWDGQPGSHLLMMGLHQARELESRLFRGRPQCHAPDQDFLILGMAHRSENEEGDDDFWQQEEDIDERREGPNDKGIKRLVAVHLQTGNIHEIVCHPLRCSVRTHQVATSLTRYLAGKHLKPGSHTENVQVSPHYKARKPDCYNADLVLEYQRYVNGGPRLIRADDRQAGEPYPVGYVPDQAWLLRDLHALSSLACTPLFIRAVRETALRHVGTTVPIFRPEAMATSVFCPCTEALLADHFPRSVIFNPSHIYACSRRLQVVGLIQTKARIRTGQAYLYAIFLVDSLGCCYALDCNSVIMYHSTLTLAQAFSDDASVPYLKTDHVDPKPIGGATSGLISSGVNSITRWVELCFMRIVGVSAMYGGWTPWGKTPEDSTIKFYDPYFNPRNNFVPPLVPPVNNSQLGVVRFLPDDAQDNESQDSILDLEPFTCHNDGPSTSGLCTPGPSTSGPSTPGPSARPANAINPRKRLLPDLD